MEGDKLVRMNVLIGGRSFPVKVDKTEIDDLKKIEKQINSKINEFMIKYPAYDRMDIIIMAFLSLIYELEKARGENSVHELETRLDDLATVLNTSL